MWKLRSKKKDYKKSPGLSGYKSQPGTQQELFLYLFNMEWEEEEVRLLCVEDLEGRGILRKPV